MNVCLSVRSDLQILIREWPLILAFVVEDEKMTPDMGV